MSRIVPCVLVLAAACLDPGEEAPATGSTEQGILGSNGVRFNSLGLNGLGANGLPLNGVRINGVRINGVRINGVRINGMEINGVRINGVRINGVRINGIWVSDVRIDGIPVNGAALDQVRISQVTINGRPPDPAEADTMTALFTYVAGCALAPHQIATFHDADDQPFDIRGVHGLDPSWLHGPPDLGKTDLVAACLQAQARTDPDVEVIDARADVATIKKLLRYMIECALPDGDAATLEDEAGQPWVVPGAFGLAPGWQHGPMTAAEREYVSACLLARSNAGGHTVQISIRSPEIAFTGTEIAAYAHHEGAFMGDLFADAPWARTCRADGPGISGRVCTTGSCGFEDLGPCASVCRAVAGSVTIDRGDASTEETTLLYDDCADGAHRNVVNTYLHLAPETTLSVGAHASCARAGDGGVHCWGLNYGSSFVDGEQLGVHLAPRLVPDDPRGDVLSMWWGPGAHGLDAPLCVREGGRAEVWCRGAVTGGAWQPAWRDDGAEQGAGSGQRLQDVAVVDDTGRVLILSDGSLITMDESLIGREQPVGHDVVRATLAGDEQRLYVLRSDGTVWDAGDRHGYGLETPLMGETGIEEFRDLCSGAGHACASNSFGEVFCWSADPSFDRQGAASRMPVRVPGLGPGPDERAATDIACGTGHACAVTDDGRVRCWTHRAAGQAGSPAVVVSRARPVGGRVFRASPAVAIQAAGDSTCARREAGDWYCWGQNDHGQLGDGTTRPAHTPVRSANHSALQP